MFISEVTVKSHINHLFAKIRARSRAEAVRYAYDHGLATSDSPATGLSEPAAADYSRGQVLMMRSEQAGVTQSFTGRRISKPSAGADRRSAVAATSSRCHKASSLQNPYKCPVL